MIQAEVDTGQRPGVTSEEAEEIRRLKAENRRLGEDVAILKAARSFFVGERLGMVSPNEFENARYATLNREPQPV